MTYVNYIDWHTTPFRTDRFFEIWRPALDRALAFGASTSYMTRNIDDPLHLRQVSVWDDKADFERYWASDEVAAMRQEAMSYFTKPLLPNWHSLSADAGPSQQASDSSSEAETAAAAE
jgi:heme-degrading monooxygenase HmoA